MLNHVVLIGRLTRDAETRHTKSGTQMTRFTIAVDRKKDEADFVPIVCFGRTAEVTADLAKGQMVAVDGRLQIDNVKGEDGWKTFVSVVSFRVVFLSPKKTKELDIGDAIDFNEDDLPF